MKATTFLIILFALASSSMAGRMPSDTTEYYIDRIDTLSFEKSCSTLVNIDSTNPAMKIEMTVRVCHWQAVTDTTWAPKIVLKLSAKEVAWLLKWLRDEMAPRAGWSWQSSFDTLGIAGDGVIDANSVLVYGVVTGAVRDSVTIDTTAMKVINR